MNILLDLDGTLTDPGPGFVASINYALTTLGHAPQPEERVVACIGPPLEETLVALLGAGHVHQLDAAVSLYRERYSATGIFESTVYEGIYEALHALQSNGARLILATSKPRIFALRILEHFGLKPFFSSAYGSELDGVHANKQHLLSHLLREERMQPESAVMIGDRAQDVWAARTNGIQSIGVLWGYGSRQELEVAGVDILVERPSELIGVLSSNNRRQGKIQSPPRGASSSLD